MTRTISISTSKRRDGKPVMKEIVTCEAEEACNAPAMSGGNQGCFHHNDDPAVVRKREAWLVNKRAEAADRKGKTHEQWLAERAAKEA